MNLCSVYEHFDKDDRELIIHQMDWYKWDGGSGTWRDFSGQRRSIHSILNHSNMMFLDAHDVYTCLDRELNEMMSMYDEYDSDKCDDDPKALAKIDRLEHVLNIINTIEGFVF